MKASKLRDLNSEELQGQQDELTKQLFHLRFQAASGQLEGGKKIASTRKDLARIKTVQNERRRATQQ